MDTNSVAISIAKILFGVGFIALVFWKLPMVELFYLFAFVVAIPLGVLAAIGLISEGTVKLFLLGAPELRRRVEDKYNEMMENLDTPSPVEDY